MRIKVLYLQSTSEIGGSDISLYRLVKAIDREKFCPYVMVPMEGPLVSRLRELGVTVVMNPEMMKLSSRGGWKYRMRYLLTYLPAVRRIVKCVKDEGINILHTNTLHNLHGWLAAKIARIPHVWHVREIVKQSKLFLILERFLIRRFTNKVIAISAAVAHELAPELIEKGVLQVIPNGVDLSEYRYEIQSKRVLSDLSLKSETPLIAFVGRLDHWKGADVFLKAVALCHKRCPSAHFLVVGGEVPGRAEYAANLYQLAESLGIRDIVHFTGWRYQSQDMPEVYSAIQLSVLASTWPEPFGLVLIEAMAMGKPVVATNHGGAPEICVNGVTGILVPPGDAQKMAEAFEFILSNPDKAQEMGTKGRKRVEEFYDETKCARKIEQLYLEMMKK